MTWKVNCVMDERVKFIAGCVEGRESMVALCERFGISRKTGYKWRRRYDAEGPEGLLDRPRAPHHHPNAVDRATVDAILECKGRENHKYAGPLKIRVYLEWEQPDRPWPSASTIGEILAARGLVKKRRRRRSDLPSATPLSKCTEANDTWCADFKGWFRTGDNARCDPLTVTDAHTRFLLGCQGLPGTCGFDAVQPIFERIFREYGLPRAMRTDNGAPFASCGLAGLTPLSVWFIRLGIHPERIRRGKPQDNGRHERMHRTLKETAINPARGSLRAQQRAFDAFVEHYNFERPHQALGQRPPGDFYRSSPHPFPKRLPDQPDYPREWTVRVIKLKGGMKWGGSEIHVSQALAGHAVGLEPIGETGWLLHFCTVPIAYFDEKARTIRPWKEVDE